MIKAIIITPWREVEQALEGVATVITMAAIEADCPLSTIGESCTDVTMQAAGNLSPDPNCFIVDTVRAEAAMELIRANPIYFILSEEAA